MRNYESGNKSSVSTSAGGVGFTGLLTIAFIVLKLCGVIEWSWLWVLSPLWISFGLVVGILLIIGIVWLIADLIGKKTKKNKCRKR